MTILLFVIILAALVFVHELGHFLAAKISGIRVDEFSIGFPPRIFSFKKGETKYSLNLIPFGGYVKIFGEDPTEEALHHAGDSRSFISKPKSIQAMVLAAGITFNLIFAWLLLSSGFLVGMPVPHNYSEGNVQDLKLIITSIAKDSPADNAGLKSGDVLLRMQSGTDVVSELDPQKVQDFTSSHANTPISILFLRGDKELMATATPRLSSDSGRAVIGIVPEVYGTLKLSLFQSLWQGAKLTVVLVKDTAIGISAFLWQAVTAKANLSEVTGPVGIANMVGDAAKLGFSYIISFTAFISINLAVINLIPFPALDGGRLLIVLIEKIKRGPLNPKVVNAVNAIGLILLLTLMVVVTFHDVFNIIGK